MSSGHRMCSVVPIILEKSLMFITLQEPSVKSTQNFILFFTITPLNAKLLIHTVSSQSATDLQVLHTPQRP